MRSFYTGGTVAALGLRGMYTLLSALISCVLKLSDFFVFPSKHPVLGHTTIRLLSSSCVPSQHPVQVLLCALLVSGGLLRAVLGVVIAEDGHHVVVAKVDRFVHRCVSPPAADGTISAGFNDQEHNQRNPSEFCLKPVELRLY